MSHKHLAIKEWQSKDRPRERLAAKGAASLSDAELLAILIRHGTRGSTALDLARALLQTYGSLAELSKRDCSELTAVHGMGGVKAITLAAAFEMGRRVESEPFRDDLIIRSPHDIACKYIPLMRGLRNERFYVLLLNSANIVFREAQVSEGSLNVSIVHPREVYRLAITESAASIVVVHNHPSGNLRASRADIQISNQLKSAGRIVGIPLQDHIIIGGEAFLSMREEGLLDD